MTLEIILGAILPPAVDLINRFIKNSTLRYIVSLLVCLVVGVVVNYQELSFTNALQSGAIVFGAAQSTYKLYWADSTAREKLFK